MSRRFFTADWHLGFARLLDIEKWPFNTIEQHDNALLAAAIKTTTSDDTIIHLGDLASIGYDNHAGISKGLDINPMQMIKTIPAEFINIRGNHDLNNKVKSIADSMQIHLGRTFPNVTCGHYPSTNKKAETYIKQGYINIHGHVHSKYKHCLDLTHQVLNINVGIMAWDFKLVSEDDLIKYIMYLLRLPIEKLNRVVIENGKEIEI